MLQTARRRFFAEVTLTFTDSNHIGNFLCTRFWCDFSGRGGWLNAFVFLDCYCFILRNPLAMPFCCEGSVSIS